MSAAVEKLVDTQRTIVVADPAPASLQALSRLLQRAGFEVAEASNGAEAVAQAHRSSPIAVILDLTGPIEDGHLAVSQLRINPRFKDAYIVALTGNSDEASGARALAAGCDDRLVKPLNLETFIFNLARSAASTYPNLREASAVPTN
jgi:two-component system alkaline phosphatase synthesis response regulator PhoP